jgi:hypothetical protein
MEKYAIGNETKDAGPGAEHPQQDANGGVA